MVTPETLLALVEIHGTPLFVMDHDELRNNYATFKAHLPRVQAYYAEMGTLPYFYARKIGKCP